MYVLHWSLLVGRPSATRIRCWCCLPYGVSRCREKNSKVKSSWSDTSPTRCLLAAMMPCAKTQQLLLSRMISGGAFWARPWRSRGPERLQFALELRYQKRAPVCARVCVCVCVCVLDVKTCTQYMVMDMVRTVHFNALL